MLNGMKSIPLQRDFKNSSKLCKMTFLPFSSAHYSIVNIKYNTLHCLFYFPKVVDYKLISFSFLVHLHCHLLIVYAFILYEHINASRHSPSLLERGGILFFSPSHRCNNVPTDNNNLWFSRNCFPIFKGPPHPTKLVPQRF